MRIFTAIRHSTDPSLYYGGLWSSNFYPALRELGHEIVESQVDLCPSSRFMHIPNHFTVQEKEVRADITQRIVEEVRRAHEKQPLDLFLSYFYNAHFDPAGFKEIQALGIPCINFYCNSIYQFDLVAEVAAKADFAWHAEKNARKLYRDAGANPVWVQMGADPKVYHPIPDAIRQARACFVGQRYADRDRWVAALINANIPVDLYGSGWGEVPKSDEVAKSENAPAPEPAQESEYLGRKLVAPGGIGGYLQAVRQNINQEGVLKGVKRSWLQNAYRQQTHQLTPVVQQRACGFAQSIPQTFAEYELVLNFSNVWADGRPGAELIPHVRLRDFEAPMCRTCYFTGHNDEITEFYEPDKEIVTYHTQDELKDKSTFYLGHPDVAEKVREAGYQRALHHHTWEKRFVQLFKETGLNS